MPARAPKRLRRVRQAGRRSVVLTPRCIDMLALTGLVRYLGSDQLARDFFSSADRCRKRLRQLFDAGYLHVSVGSSQTTNIVSLTREGLAAVTAARPALASRVGRSGVIRLQSVGHHLAIVDIRLYAAALGQARTAPLIRWSNGGSDRFEHFGFKMAHLVPDGLAEFETEHGPIAVAIEVDLGTEALAVLAKKCERYVHIAARRQVDALWIYAPTGPKRRANIVQLIASHGLAAWARVLDAELVRARPVGELPSRVLTPKAPSSTTTETAKVRGVGGETLATDRRVDMRGDGWG